MDAYIQHQVRLENLKEGEAREVARLLTEAHDRILDRLGNTSGAWTRQRYEAQLAAISDALDDVMANGVKPMLRQEGLEFTARNMMFHVEQLDIQKARSTASEVSGAIVSSNLTAEAVFTAATAEPMQGKIMAQWADELTNRDKRIIASTLRQAWLSGDSVNNSAKELQTVFAKSKRDLQTITRTYFGHLSAQSRDAVWRENADLMDGIIWESVLDARTTISICAPRDQKQYTLSGEPVGHSLPYLNGPSTAHWNCRSLAVPNLIGVPRTVRRPAVGAGSNYERGDNTTRTGRVRKNTAANRRSGKIKETTVGPRTDYESWLKRQPKAFQQDVLGAEKAEAFRKGEWSLGERFSPQNPTTMRNF